MTRLSNVIIGMLIFGGLMLGAQVWFGEIQTSYAPGGTLDSTTFQEYEGVMNRTDETLGRVLNHTAGFVNKPVLDLTKYYDATLIFLGVLAIIAEFPGMALSYANLAITALPGGLIPDWFRLMIGIVIVAVFVFIIAAIATKRDEL